MYTKNIFRGAMMSCHNAYKRRISWNRKWDRNHDEWGEWYWQQHLFGSWMLPLWLSSICALPARSSFRCRNGGRNAVLAWRSEGVSNGWHQLTKNCIASNHCLVGGFNPFEKYESNRKSSPNRDEHEKYLSCHHLVVEPNDWHLGILQSAFHFSPWKSATSTSGKFVSGLGGWLESMKAASVEAKAMGKPWPSWSSKSCNIN